MRQKLETFQQAEEFVFSIPKFTTKNTQEDTRNFYEFIGTPGEDRNIVHVAGTNGKGSVCAYLGGILKEYGFNTAIFTSPHLVNVCERFSINGNLLPEEDFLYWVNYVNEYVDAWNDIQKKEYHPSFFEFLFFMAMLYFQEKNVQFIILETGLGGRLDATNIISKPKACVITKIGMDHCEYLGDTLGQIASEKAGIIKKDVPIIYLDFDKEVSEVIEKRAELLNATTVPVKEEQILKIKNHQNFIDFSFLSRYDGCVDVSIPTFAYYQVMNSLLAVRTAEVLFANDMFDNDSHDDNSKQSLFYQRVTNALHGTLWEGRMEEVFPNLFVDGAHNEDGVNAFIDTIRQVGEQNCILLFGVNRDKAYHKMIEKLASESFYSEIVVTTICGQRAANAEELLDIFRQYTNRTATAVASVPLAVEYVRQRAREDRHVYAVGSLYLVGEIKKLAHEGGNHD